MAMRALALSPSQSSSFGLHQSMPSFKPSSASPARPVRAYAKADEQEEEKKKVPKQSLFGNITEALDFSQVRSEKDAELLYEARDSIKDEGRMTREQYAALRRKIGGTYKDFFKSYVEVDGEYVEEGWVDKTCKVCKKDTRGEPRQVDNLGRYMHVACAENSKPTNFFSKLFSR
ncbi:hypothetical protein CFC21_042719 [Triticum aestivum]|uniref:GATA-type transcription activator N-terminal domain-containing protein n=3 Tax=Triticum TaxID=4564 RepID=A0A9R1FN24_WHEAT|nr:uncharacterized protein LOC123071238 [Triticum aestivum]KAF7031380.1 hypothetical protein CFC21_042718 [Triticum aestivum]KAF7031381.1 hypothetical protein CFC21_042719 [Triticum aestivum]VAH81289.1 unnamed protein product [Triticum turgidum subsp. durum]